MGRSPGGRSTRELLDLIERIGKACAAFRSLGYVDDNARRVAANIAKLPKLLKRPQS
jgi:hypothetical protein